MCGGGGAPIDKSAETAQIQAAENERARQEAARQAEEQKRAFESRLSSAYGTGIDSARNFFASQGLDPDQYINSIQSSANSAKSRVPELDASPGTYFDNLGASVFEQLQEAERSKALRGIDSFAREGFANRRITNDVDDPFLAAILEERRAEADNYARRLLDRGVVTNSGYEAAIADLEKQRPGADMRLQDIGLAELERGRGQLRDLASTGRSNASQLRLGEMFDPYEIEGDLNRTQSDFFARLGERLRANAPKNLFDTSGLAGIAGAAQGAQNTAFDPDALAGLYTDEEEEDDNVLNEEDDAFVSF